MDKKTLGIIGYGSFGRFIYEVLSKHLPGYEIKVYSRSNKIDNKVFFEKSEVFSADVVIPCVPISAFNETIKEAAELAKENALIIDVCSVKVYPKQIMIENLGKKSVYLVSTHPMFGPATYAKLGGKLTNLNFVIENINLPVELYKKLVEFLSSLELHIVEMSADEHDRLAARFHFLAQFVAAILKDLELKRSIIDTKSAAVMFDYLDMIGTDKSLVKELYKYNPYCKIELEKFNGSYKKLIEHILN